MELQDKPSSEYIRLGFYPAKILYIVWKSSYFIFYFMKESCKRNNALILKKKALTCNALASRFLFFSKVNNLHLPLQIVLQICVCLLFVNITPNYVKLVKYMQECRTWGEVRPPDFGRPVNPTHDYKLIFPPDFRTFRHT